MTSRPPTHQEELEGPVRRMTTDRQTGSTATEAMISTMNRMYTACIVSPPPSPPEQVSRVPVPGHHAKQLPIRQPALAVPAHPPT